MSLRVAKKSIVLPKGVEVKITSASNGTQAIVVKGPKGSLEYTAPKLCQVAQNDNELTVELANMEQTTIMLAGTTRANVNNMVVGVTEGFQKKLLLVGVGYRALLQGKSLSLTLGFSHPVNHPIPDGIIITTPQPTEIIIEGIDKQRVGQVAAEIRAYRPPEPYKGKGVRYHDERIIKKETKK